MAGTVYARPERPYPETAIYLRKHHAAQLYIMFIIGHRPTPPSASTEATQEAGRWVGLLHYDDGACAFVVEASVLFVTQSANPRDDRPEWDHLEKEPTP